MATTLGRILAEVPTGELAELKRYVRTGQSRFRGPYGFTSSHVMVRGDRVSLWGADRNYRIDTVKKALEALGDGVKSPSQASR